MRVMSGWSAEVRAGEWDKHDVTLEEEDWTAWLFSNDLIDPMSGISLHVIPLNLKYQIMECLAQKLVLAYIAARHPSYGQDVREKLTSLVNSEQALLNKVRNQKNPEADAGGE